MASPLLHRESPENASSDDDTEIQQQRPGFGISRFLRGGYLVAALTLFTALVTLSAAQANGKLRGTSTVDFQQKTGIITDHACLGEPDLYCEEVILPAPLSPMKWECRGGMPIQCPTNVCTDGCGCGCEITETTTISSISSTSFTETTTITSISSTSVSISSISSTSVSISSTTTASATTVTTTISTETSTSVSISTTTVTTTTRFHKLASANGNGQCLSYNINMSTAFGFVCTRGRQPGDGLNFMFQLWQYEASSQNLFSAPPGYELKCLQVGNPLNDERTIFATAMAECGVSDTLKWTFETSDDHHIEAAGMPGWCLQLVQGWEDPENNVQVQKCSNDTNQAWAWL